MHKPPLNALTRPARPPSHRSLLIDAMRSLALAKGLPATTVEEVCERAGVTKGSFYHHFHSKDDLAVAALHAYHDDVVAAFKGGGWDGFANPYVRLQAFVRHAGEVLGGPVMIHGCMLGSFSLDLAENAPDMRELLSAMLGELRDMTAAVIAEAAEHQGREVDAARLGDQFLAVIEGTIVLAKAHGDQAIRRHGMELFGQYLALLLEGPQGPGPSA